MTEETPASGNRWEPHGDEPATSPTTVPEAGQSMPVVVERRRWRDRVRPAVAGAVAGTAIVTGVGGFAIGRATTDTEPSGGDQQQVGFVSGDRDGDGGFPGGPDGGPDGGADGGPDGGPGRDHGGDDDQQAEPGSST